MGSCNEQNVLQIIKPNFLIAACDNGCNLEGVLFSISNYNLGYFYCALAQERFQTISAAYDYIKDQRNII